MGSKRRRSQPGEPALSRETDTSSSGPNGHGGAAYPSGTPPYGTPMASDGGADAGRSAARPEERKTETTLTTRIRINIPGSRPIPPVVVRQPVADAESSGGTREPGPAPADPGPPPVHGPVDPPGRRPRRRPRRRRATGSRRASPARPRAVRAARPNGAGLPGGSGPPRCGAGAGVAPPVPRPVPGRCDHRRRCRWCGQLPGGSRPGGTNGAGLPGATGGPVAPGHGGGTGSFDVTEALAAGPLGNGHGNAVPAAAPATAAVAAPRRPAVLLRRRPGRPGRTYGPAGGPHRRRLLAPPGTGAAARATSTVGGRRPGRARRPAVREAVVAG